MLNLAFTLPTVALLHKTSSNFSRLEILHILPKCKCLSNFARVKRCRHEYLKTCHVSLTIWFSRIKTYFICIFYVKLLRRILLYLKLAYSREQYARGDLFHRNCQLCILLKVGQATVVRELVEIQKNSNIGCEKIAKTSIRRRGLLRDTMRTERGSWTSPPTTAEYVNAGRVALSPQYRYFQFSTRPPHR